MRANSPSLPLLPVVVVWLLPSPHLVDLVLQNSCGVESWPEGACKKHMKEKQLMPDLTPPRVWSGIPAAEIYQFQYFPYVFDKFLSFANHLHNLWCYPSRRCFASFVWNPIVFQSLASIFERLRESSADRSARCADHIWVHQSLPDLSQLGRILIMSHFGVRKLLVTCWIALSNILVFGEGLEPARWSSWSLKTSMSITRCFYSRIYSVLCLGFVW